jgi:hypothetical protein
MQTASDLICIIARAPQLELNFDQRHERFMQRVSNLLNIKHTLTLDRNLLTAVSKTAVKVITTRHEDECEHSLIVVKGHKFNVAHNDSEFKNLADFITFLANVESFKSDLGTFNTQVFNNCLVVDQKLGDWAKIRVFLSMSDEDSSVFIVDLEVWTVWTDTVNRELIRVHVPAHIRDVLTNHEIRHNIKSACEEALGMLAVMDHKNSERMRGTISKLKNKVAKIQ